jgi:YD repeat-containing protein
MVAIVGGGNVGGNGNSALGLENSSLSLGGTGLRGNAAAGNSGDTVFVNAATGNLVIQRQDEILADIGTDTQLLRTYNSLGRRTDDNADNWQMSVVCTVGSLTGTLNTAGSSITRTDGDGSSRVFAFDDQRNLYLNRDGQDAFDTLAYAAGSNGSWTFTDGASGRTETFDWNGASGRITAAADADGNTTRYGYTGSLLTLITDAAGERTRLNYSGTLLTDVRTERADGSALTRVRYAYDASQRLTTVTVDLSPEDQSVVDGKTYVTRYAYVGSSTMLQSLTQSDGTSYTFNSYDSLGRLTGFTQAVNGINRVTTLAYGSGETRVTDAVGAVTTYKTDSAGRLSGIVTPAQALSYEYDSNGRLSAQIDGNGNRTVYAYDGNGNQVLQRDAAGNTITRIFGGRNELLTETRYAAPDTDGAGAVLPGLPQTTRYAYDGKNRLRFVVTAEGRVTEYRYSGQGLRTVQIAYAGNRYPVGTLTVTAALSESTLVAWTAGADKSKLARTDHAYDARGNLSRSISFSKTLASTGEGVVDGTESVSQFTYDQAGLLLASVSATGSATTANANDGITRYGYDGLGRLVTTTDALGNTTLQQVDLQGNTLTTRQANGLSTTSVRNAAGELVSVMEADGATALGKTAYTYDAAGRLRVRTDATGVNTFWLYDAAGRKSAEIDGNGSFTEWQYNNNDQVARTIRYATALTAAQLASLTDAAGNPSTVALASLRPTAMASRSTWNLYDDANRLAKTVDELGFVTQYQYDGASRLVASVQYSKPVNAANITAATRATDASVSPLADAFNDRKTSVIFDNDGRQVGSVDADGYLTQTDYDAAGRLVHSVRYAKPDMTWHGMSSAAMAGRTAAEANNIANVHAWTFYDGQGRESATVDGEGFVKEIRYDLAGNRRTEVQYLQVQGGLIDKLLAGTQSGQPALTGPSLATINDYDTLNRLIRSTNAEGTVTQHAYDNAGNLVRTDRAWNTTDLRTTATRYDKLGRMTAALSGEGSAALAALPATATTAQIDAVWNKYATTFTYDAASRQTGSTDPLGNRTLRYYDADGQVSHVINGAGEVTAYSYDALGQMTQSVRYAAAIGKDVLASLSGGLVNATLTSAVAGIASANDARVTTTYTLRGQIDSKIDEQGYLSRSTWNAFGEQDSGTRQIDATRQVRNTLAYNRRGLVSNTVEDAGVSNRSTSIEYDAFGRMVRRTEPGSRVQQWTYDRTGRVIQTMDPYRASDSFTYDAIGRELTHTNALGNTSSTVYDDVNRSMTVTSAEAVTMTSTRNRHGELVQVRDAQNRTTSYQYNRDGRLTRTSYDNVPVANTSGASTTELAAYDTAGRLFESTDGNGVVTRLTYDAANRVLTRITDPNGLKRTTSTSYDGRNRSVTVTDANGVVTRTTYNRKGDAVTVAVDPDGMNLQTSYAYDGLGNTVTVTEGAGSAQPKITTYAYDNLGRRTSEAVAGSGAKTDYAYDAANRLEMKTDALGNVTRLFYDPLKPVTYVIDPEGGVTRATLDAEGRTMETRRYATRMAGTMRPDFSKPVPVPESADDQVTTNLYDRDGRLAFVVDGTRGVSERKFDGNGNVTGTVAYANRLPATVALTTDAIRTATRAAGFADAARDERTHAVYDGLNRLTLQIDGAGSLTTWAYDGAGNVTEQRAYANTAVIDPIRLGDSTYVPVMPAVDENRDRHVMMAYDTVGRLVASATALKASGSAAGSMVDWAVTLHDYKTAGAVMHTQLATPLVSQRPSAAQLLGAARNADRDLTTVEWKDAAGRIAYTINANRIVTSYSVDKLGRVVSTRTYGQPLANTVNLTGLTSASLATYLVSTAADRSSRTVYDAASRPVYAIDSQGAVTKTMYDALGNPVTIIAYATLINAAGVNDRSLASDVQAMLKPNAVLDRTERRFFDGNGHAVYRLDASGYVTQSDYDALGRLVATTEHATAIDSATSTRTGVLNALNGQSEAQKANSRSNRFSFDAAGRLKDSTDGVGRRESFVYDGIGRKTGFTDKNGAYWDSVYDAGGRLVKETSAQVEVLRFKTDANGAILLDAAGNPVADATGLRHIITLTNYDSLGNVIDRTEAAGLPEQRTTRYVYSADGRQVSTILPTVAVYADEGSAVLANGAAGNAARKDVTVTPTSTVTYDALGNAVVNRDIGGKVRYRVIDSAGQLRYEVDAMGYVTGYERNSFGEVIALTRYAKEINTSARGATAYTVADIDKLIAANDHRADRTIRTAYDNLGRIVKVTEPLVEAYDATGALGTTSFTAARTTDKLYNAFGEVIRQSVYGADAAGRAVTVSTDTGYAFNTLGQQVAIVTMAERAAGATSAKGYLTVLQYDSRGNLAEQVEYAALRDFADSAWNSVTGVSYGVDPVTSADRRTRFAYDANNRKVAETRADIAFATRPDNSSNASTTMTRGDATTRYAYDGVGNITSVTDAVGTVTYRYYDLLGRVVATPTPSVQRLRAQVAQVYAAILNRSPDKAGLDLFVNKMLAGTTLEQVTESINASDEAQAWRNSTGMAWFRQMAATDTSRAIVTMLYRQLLSREPDAAGIDGWVRLMNGQTDGVKRTTGQITVAMIRAVASEMNTDAVVVNDKTRAALAFVDAGGSDATVARQDAALAAASAQRRILVAQLHVAILGRVPDTTKLNEWANSTLDAGKLAQLFMSSDEGRVLYPSSLDATQVLQRLFGNIHDRAPTAEEVAALKAGRTQWTLEDYAGCVNAMLQGLNAPAVSASSTATMTARIGFSRKVASVLNSIDAFSGPMPMSEFKYDALGNLVQRVDYANAAEIAIAAGTWGPGGNAADRMSYTSYDAQGRALQRIDTQRTTVSTPRTVSNTSYDVFGHVAKEWRTVTDLDGRQATTFTVNRYDANGQKTETVTPGTPAEGATQATATVSGRTEFNAFGEVVVRKTDEVATEFNEYDNAGHLWRSNAGDGVTRIAQFDAQGRQTVELRSAVVNLRTEVSSASQAVATAGMIRSETRYDLMGRVVAQIKPEQLLDDIDSNTGAPTAITVSLQVKVNSTANPDVQEQPNGGDTRKQVLYWTGKNNVNLQWTSLAGLGSGDIKVQFDYLSRPVAAGDYPQSLNVVPNTDFPSQAGTLTRTFSADDAATGVALEWGDAATPGFDRMTGVTVWKKDVNGNWTQVLKTAREGVLGSQVRFNAPPDLTTAYELYYRPANATADIKVGGERLWHLGDQLVFDTTGMAEGDYSYTLRSLKEGSNTVATVNGGISITSPERRAQVARLFAVLLNRAPDANGLQSHLKALEAGTSMAQLAQNLLNTAEARNLYPATLSATQFVQNLLSITLGTPLAQSQAFATAAATRLGANPGNWGVGIIALLDDVAASRDPALATARALLANKTAVATVFAGEYGGYRYNDAREVMRLVTATDTSAALALAKQALWRRQLTQLYVGLLQRSPDGAGLQVWLDAMVKGTGIDAIARGLLDSAEGKLVYPPALSNTEFVTRVYEKVFGRTPDAEGQAFWTAALIQNPDRSRVAQDMMRVVTEYLGDNSVIQGAKQLLNNRIAIGLAFADSGSTDARAATAINAAVTAATNVATAASQMAASVNANTSAVQANATAVDLAAMSTPAERTLAQLSALYVVLLNRAPDRAGLLGQAAGLPPQLPLASALANTAQAIYASPEAQVAGLYLNLTDAAFVGQVVKFAFNRAPTAAETTRWVNALGGNPLLRGSVALSIINDALTYDGPDVVLADSRNLLNARIAAGMTFALNLGGEDATLARTMLAKVTATNTVDALKLASDTLSAAAAARSLAAASATSAAVPRVSVDATAADAQAKALIAVDAARALATSSSPEADQAHAIVRAWYAVTGKAPDLTAFTQAFAQMRSGASVATLIQGLLAGTDGLARYPATLDNTQFVNKVYANVINRAPDADGLAYWKRALDAGASRSQVLFDITYAFLNLSDASAADLKQRTAVLQQMQTTLANLGTAARALPALYDYSASTVLASRATPAERSYTQVTQLYVALLGRAPERAGLLYQASVLQTGDAAAWNTRFAQIASNILNSGEAQGNGYANLTDSQFVSKFYLSALGRNPSAAESAKWLTMLGGDTGKRGQSIVAMLDDMLVVTPSDSTLLSAQNLFNNRIAAGLTFALDLGGSDLVLARAVNARVTATDTATAISHASTTLVTALTAPSAAVYPNADTALTRINAELAAADTLAQASSAFDSAAAIATPAATASGADTAVLITRLYRAVFNRAPDNEGFNWWFQNIKNGQTIESVAQAFIGSGEALTTYPPSSTNTDFVNRVYANLLGRAPDAEGLAYWTNNLNRGMTRGKVFLDVLNAYLGNTKATLPDLQRRASFNQNVATALATSVSLNPGTSQYTAYVAARDKATADVNAGVALLDTARKLDAASTAANTATAATAASSANLTAQITLLYLAALNRVPDIPGLLNNLQSGLGIAGIASNVVASAEAQSLYPASLSATDFVTRVYQSVIGRAPDAGGLAYWTAEINGGKPRGAVLWSIVSSALTNTTNTFTVKVATSDLQSRSKLLQRWATALTSLRSTASAGSNAATALANLVSSNTGSTSSLISQANALAPTGATGSLPQRQTQVVRLYALLLNRAPSVDELNTATTLLQNGKTVVDIAGSLLTGTALTVPQLIDRTAQQALGNVPDAALRARWSSQFAGQSLAQAAAGLSAEIVGYQGNDLSALTVQNTFKGKTGQYLTTLAVQASAIGSAAVAERTALLNGLLTAGTRAQAETSAASAQVTAKTAVDAAAAIVATPTALQATKLAQAYQAILGRAPDVIGFGNYLAQLQGKTNLPAEYNRIAQELLDSAEGRALYPSTLSNSQFVTQAYSRIIGRAPDAGGLEFWTKALATMPHGQLLLDVVNVFLTNPNATAVDLQSRSVFLQRIADAFRVTEQREHLLG